MTENNFYDTSALLLRAGDLFEKNENIIISSITLSELENIKTSSHKDAEVKYAARRITHLLDENPDKYTIWIFKNSMLQPAIDNDLEINNDIKILMTAYNYESLLAPDDMNFITNDIALKNIANLFFGSDSIKSIDPEEDDYYLGYQDCCFDDSAMSEFYQNLNYNHFDSNINEYLIVRNTNREIVDKLRWDGERYVPITFATLDSTQLGRVKPYKDDIQQAFAIDSLIRNKITVLRGPAGSGKSFLSLGFLFHKLEKKKIDKIIIFCNTVATKDSAKLGYYPGTRTEKLLDSQIGNFLSGKLGDRTEVERLINEGKLELLPLSDIRGFDTTGMNAGVYITEAQNLNINLIKLALQRIGDDCICIIDGDDKTQTDLIDYEGANNGMKRLSKVFRGQDIYGEITLKNIHRSRIASLAEEL